MRKRQFQVANAKVGKKRKYSRNRKKKRPWLEQWANEWVIKYEIREVGRGQIRAFLGHDKNFILSETENSLRLRNMYLPI